MMTEFTFHNYKNRLTLKNKLCRLLWNIYAMFFFRAVPTNFLNGIRLAGLRLFGARIGRRGVSVHRSVRIWAPWNLEMEDYTLIDRDCRIYNPDFVTLKSETVVSENAFLCTASHDVHSRAHGLVTKPITCCGRNWIAADAMVLPGVELGEGSVVGAGSVVVRNVAPWTIVGGNPATVIGKREFRD